MKTKQKKEKKWESMYGETNPAKRIEVRAKLQKIKSQLYRDGKLVSHNKGKTKNNYEPLKRAGKKCSKTLKISGARKGKNNPNFGNHKLEGTNHPNWLGGIGFEPYTKEFNDKFKRAIRKRDNYICLKCGKHQEKEKHSLAVHHINYDKKLTLKENCCAVCSKCNGEINFNREQWIIFFQSILSKLYGYQYNDKYEIILELNKQQRKW